MMNFKKMILCGMTMGIMAAAAAGVSAATFTTDDGVLSIETPDPAAEGDATWVQSADPNYWFTVSNGRSSITIDHLSNGEILPQVQIANETYPDVFQSFVSTKDEVFVIKGLASTEEDMGELMKIAGTVKVLKFGTKHAVVPEKKPEKANFTIKTFETEKDFYVTSEELYVRSSYSVDAPALGILKKNELVKVKGKVLKNDADYGWYLVSYEGRNAFVSAGFVTDKEPEKHPVAEGFQVYDEKGQIQGNLVKYSDGYFYSNDMQPYKDNGDGSYFGVRTGDTLYNYNPVPEVVPETPETPETPDVPEDPAAEEPAAAEEPEAAEQTDVNVEG